MNRFATIGLAAVCLLPSAFLYLYALDRSPVYLGLDEAHFAVHARAIADTGRDLNGDPLPLFINLADPLGDQTTLAWGASWYHPLVFYLIAIALKVLPFTEASVRTPTALLAGVLNIALMYAVVFRLFRVRWIAVAAAAMLALTPAHLILGRQALDYVAPLPFQLAWLWCVLAFRDTERIGYAFAGGVILGCGCYSYVSSWVVMPACLAMSWLVYRRSRAGGFRPLAAAGCGFAIPLLLLVPWLWSHPQMISNVLDAQSRSTVERFGHGQPLVRVAQQMLTTYWSYFNPAFLFFTGGPSLNAATGQAGVFLLPVAILLPVGVAMLARESGLGAVRWLLLIGLLLAPVAPALKGEPHVIQRTLGMLPFAVAISSVGVFAMWRSGNRVARAVVAVLLLAMPLQFAFFYRDYLTEYRFRSAQAYDRTAFVETAKVLLDADTGRSVLIYLTAPLYDVSAKWRFYTTKHGREEVLRRTRYFGGDLSTIGEAPADSLAVVDAEDRRFEAAIAVGAWSLEQRITDLTGRPTLVVLKRR